MSTTEKASPPAAADAVTPQLGDATADAAEAGGPSPSGDAAPNASETSETLSPAVRRLVRQFDLDITGIHGTGPSGRIRVGDVMTLLGGRTDTGRRDPPIRRVSPYDGAEPSGVAVAEPVAALTERSAAAEASTERPAAVEPARHDVFPTTTVFDCDVSRVLAHRRRLRRDNVELLTTSYFVTAFAAALETARDLAALQSVRFGVSLTTADGRLRSSVLEVPETLPEKLDERVRLVDIALRANLHTPLEHATLLVHHYGESGSLLATPTPIGAGHAASVGIGRVRREIVVRVVDGVETPRAAVRCYLSISFFDGRVPFHRVNRALADAVGILENWPD